MIDHELCRDARDAPRGEVTVLRKHERGLEVVVERHDAAAVEREAARRRLAIEVDQDSIDDDAFFDRARAREGQRGGVVVGAPEAHDLGERRLVDLAFADVGVERIDEGVRLRVVAEEHLADERAVVVARRGERGA